MAKTKIDEVCSNRIKSSDSWICYQCREDLIKLDKLKQQMDEIEAKLKGNIMQHHNIDRDETLECVIPKRPRLDPTVENVE